MSAGYKGTDVLKSFNDELKDPMLTPKAGEKPRGPYEDFTAKTIHYVHQEIERGVRDWIAKSHGEDFAAHLESALKANVKYREELDQATALIEKLAKAMKIVADDLDIIAIQPTDVAHFQTLKSALSAHAAWKEGK